MNLGGSNWAYLDSDGMNTPINILVLEEGATDSRLILLVKSVLGTSVRRIVRATSFESAAIKASRIPIDLFLLRENSHHPEGFFKLAEGVANPASSIIVSSNRDKAVEAFEYGALDFVLEPVKEARLDLAFQRFLEGPENRARASRLIPIKTHEGIVYLPKREILYVKGSGVYSELFLRDGTSCFYEKNLNKALHVLGSDFMRIHKSYIISRSDVAMMRRSKGSRYVVELYCGKRLPIGRTRIAAFQKELSTNTTSQRV